MKLIKWQPWMELGIKKFDDQHLNLIDILNNLYNAFMKKEHKESLDVFLQELLDYTNYHFREEEKYFRMFEYPQEKEHVEYHQAFINKIYEFIEESKKNRGAVTFKLMSFLREWLVNHIAEEDKKYVPLFKKKGL